MLPKAPVKATDGSIVVDISTLVVPEGSIGPNGQVDMSAAPADTPQYATVLEFAGTPQTLDIGLFFPFRTILGPCLYETYIRLDTNDPSAKYDFSDGWGGAHAMLRNPFNGNFSIGVAVDDATNESPIVITTDEAHPFQSGNQCVITGVEGNDAANGTFTITRINATSFSLNGSTGDGAYTGGGVVSGPLAFGSTGVVSFGADDTPYEGQWAYSATHVDMTNKRVVMVYDGVPVGSTSFVGNRTCTQGFSIGQSGFIGGSDHANLLGALACYRIFEGTNPYTGALNAYAPPVSFGGQQKSLAGTMIAANLLMGFGTKSQVVADVSSGFGGETHSGQLRGVLGGVTGANEGSPPQFATDPTFPDINDPVQPSGRTYSPVSPPANALVFDSIERKNSTYAWNGFGGLGSTESGSEGPLEWSERNSPGPTDFKLFGILNEEFVYLGVGNAIALAWVPVSSTDIDIRVSRKTSSTYGSGVSTGIVFRYVDDQNYCFANTRGSSRGSQTLGVGKVIAGVTSSMTGDNTACPASWETLRVVTNADGTYQIYCDATLLVDQSNSNLAATTIGAGIVAAGGSANFHSFPGYGLALRYRNFTVLPG